LDAAFIREFHLPDDIFHIGINFQGCNAAFPALRIADLIAKSDVNAKVLVVCVELCTLHFQPKNNHDNLLSNTIFGDGAAAVIILSDNKAAEYHLKGLGIDGFYSCIIDEGRQLMGWNITPVNFEMILDAGVPAFIGNKINELMMKASLKFNIAPDKISRWAVHPGGRKILDLVKKSLSLNDQKMSYSYKVLSEYGNMSSPTILFILNQIMNDHLEQGETIFSIGFGPGINIDTSLFTYA
jgi:predicted naringenin-chalcone synthase